MDTCSWRMAAHSLITKRVNISPCVVLASRYANLCEDFHWENHHSLGWDERHSWKCKNPNQGHGENLTRPAMSHLWRQVVGRWPHTIWLATTFKKCQHFTCILLSLWRLTLVKPSLSKLRLVTWLKTQKPKSRTRRESYQTSNVSSLQAGSWKMYAHSLITMFKKSQHFTCTSPTFCYANLCEDSHWENQNPGHGENPTRPAMTPISRQAVGKWLHICWLQRGNTNLCHTGMVVWNEDAHWQNDQHPCCS